MSSVDYQQFTLKDNIPYRYSWMLLAALHPIASLRYYPRRFFAFRKERRKWRVVSHEAAVYRLRSDELEVTMEMSEANLSSLIHEYALWEEQYLFPGIAGKTVLDCGAGCGETALFYLRHGAAKVICIEPDHLNADCLRRNAVRNGWPVDVIEDFCRPEHLHLLRYDYVKMDIEGSECILLLEERIPKIVLECHTNFIMKALAHKFPELKVIDRHPIYETCIMSNCVSR